MPFSCWKSTSYGFPNMLLLNAVSCAHVSICIHTTAKALYCLTIHNLHAGKANLELLWYYCRTKKNLFLKKIKTLLHILSVPDKFWQRKQIQQKEYKLGLYKEILAHDSCYLSRVLYNLVPIFIGEVSEGSFWSMTKAIVILPHNLWILDLCSSAWLVVTTVFQNTSLEAYHLSFFIAFTGKTGYVATPLVLVITKKEFP